MYLPEYTWDKILDLKLKIESYNEDINSFQWSCALENIKIAVEYKGKVIIYVLNENDAPSCIEEICSKIILKWNCKSVENLLNTFRVYAPLIFSKFCYSDKPFVIAHFAQTLDGKIATDKGNSKWIGNEENLIHAHRLRALSDIVIIGGNTVKNDQPKLNVRHVKGDNPKRVVISGSNHSLESLINACDHEVIVVSDQDLSSHSINSEHIKIESETSDVISPKKIVLKLAERGYQTIFVEGGARTISLFHRFDAIDYMQVHISPIFFGSGKNPYISKNEIESVSEAPALSSAKLIQMGDAIMYCGYLKPI